MINNNREKSPQEEFRQALIDQLKLEIIGPVNPSEVIDVSPRQRYSAGILFPSQIPNLEIDDDGSRDDDNESKEDTLVPDLGILDTELSSVTSSKSGREDITSGNDDTITMANTYMPSAIGLTFICDNYKEGLIVYPKAGVYKSGIKKEGERELSVWQRSELNLGKVKFSLEIPDHKDIEIREQVLYEELKIRAVIRRRRNGTRLTTVSLFNSKKLEGGGMPSPADCYYQAEFSILTEDRVPVFHPYQELNSTSDDLEEQGLRLMFRNRLSFGLGHGCAVDWNNEDSSKAWQVKTDSLPTLKIPPVEPRQIGGEELSMVILSGGADGVDIERVPGVLLKLVVDYEKWIELQVDQVSSLEAGFQDIAKSHIEKCREACERIRKGIAIITKSDVALQSFCLANKAMLMQQYHSNRKSRGLNDNWDIIPSDYSPAESWLGRWRNFQIAFILMNIPSLTPDNNGDFCEDRDLVDLIWFPTGGGKTEAYLGLAAYVIFLRRFMDPTDSGCSVLMRYTLRLLTAQQFQRAGALICACESIRQENPEILGLERITIGLWVGQSLTPNTRDEAVKILNDLASKPKETENKFQLLKCPWCGTRLDDTNKLGYRPLRLGQPRKVVRFICPESRCSYSTSKNTIPVLVTDEDIYDEPPTLVIGTVDKFAMLAWRKESGRIFGKGMPISPPNLIIQDELHLISGPLGTVVGLYEGVIDLLCSSKGIKPKIIGSTATIRRAKEQCSALYNRPVFQFPPAGLDISDSYFAVENPEASGRIYAGVFASAAPSFVTANIRTSASLLQGCYAVDLPDKANESVRDPYWTLVQYFNSLRELGRALTLLQADIPEHILTIRNRSKGSRRDYRWLNNIEELTSRKTAQEIPQILEDLEVTYNPDQNNKKKPIDALLATNMISVGVDVDRLGLMSIVGQPKTTSEYIQASSRVGRSKGAPGLVVTMYNPGKPRDRSHFEQFRTYHSSLYRYVEPTSVTPYSIPSLKRALHSLVIIIGRHIGQWRMPEDADFSNPSVFAAISELCDRCKAIDPGHLDVFTESLNALKSHWISEEFDDWGSFINQDPDSMPLMFPAGMPEPEEWKDVSWATPSSMRSVDKESEASVLNVYPD